MKRYLKGYYNLIENAKSEKRSKKTGIFEKHHIIPKSFGGSDTQKNLVLLTPKEHYIAHYLLTKFTRGRLRQKAWLAFKSMHMGNDKQPRSLSSRLYEENRKNFIDSITGEGNGMYGRTHTEESRKRMSEAKKGKNVGKNNYWHHTNRSQEELKERAVKSRETQIKNYDNLSDEEKLKKKKEQSKKSKLFWENSSKEFMDKHRQKSIENWENKSEEEKQEINKKKSLLGEKNGRALKYTITSPLNEVFEVNLTKNLELFCKKHDLHFHSLYKLRKNGGIVKEPSPQDKKIFTDEFYKYLRTNTIGWQITSERLNTWN